MPSDDPHDQPEKHIQLGADPTKDDRTELSPEAWDAVWEHAITVDSFKAELAVLVGEDPLVLLELARTRHDLEGNA